MSDAHKRRKQPEEVRRKAMECAVRIISEKGPGAVTLQAVADGAGVTKGGLLHHFPDKTSLTQAVSGYLLDKMNAEILNFMDRDPVEYGRFTRAYVKSISADLTSAQNEQWMAVAVYSITESASRSLWNDWIRTKEREHQDTDCDTRLQILRYAADGIWFEAVMGKDAGSKKHADLLFDIIRMTYPDGGLGHNPS